MKKLFTGVLLTVVMIICISSSTVMAENKGSIFESKNSYDEFHTVPVDKSRRCYGFKYHGQESQVL